MDVDPFPVSEGTSTAFSWVPTDTLDEVELGFEDDVFGGGVLVGVGVETCAAATILDVVEVGRRLLTQPVFV